MLQCSAVLKKQPDKEKVCWLLQGGRWQYNSCSPGLYLVRLERDTWRGSTLGTLMEAQCTQVRQSLPSHCPADVRLAPFIPHCRCHWVNEKDTTGQAAAGKVCLHPAIFHTVTSLPLGVLSQSWGGGSVFMGLIIPPKPRGFQRHLKKKISWYFYISRPWFRIPMSFSPEDPFNSLVLPCPNSLWLPCCSSGMHFQKKI